VVVEVLEKIVWVGELVVVPAAPVAVPVDVGNVKELVEVVVADVVAVVE
jgi:hypothetical protein